MSAGAARLRGVLLDVDGTLVASNDAHARSWVDAFRDFGYEIAYERVRPLIGEGGDKLLPQLTGLDHESARAKELTERRWEIFKRDYLPHLVETPGARELVARLRAAGLEPIVATSAKEDEVHAILEQAGLSDLVPERTSSDDADRSKPDPDIVCAALARGRLDAAEALLVGDTPYDVTAGRRAGVEVIGLRCGGWDDVALAGAAAVYDDPAALVAAWARSPVGVRVG